MASPTQWTWVWVDSGSWWWTGRPGVLRFMGLQSRTRLSNWTELNFISAIDPGLCWTFFKTSFLKDLFFLLDHFSSLFWIRYNMASVLCFGFLPWGMWDPSSQTRGQTCNPCTGRQSANHWTIWKVPQNQFWKIYRDSVILSKGSPARGLLMFHKWL